MEEEDAAPAPWNWLTSWLPTWCPTSTAHLREVEARILQVVTTRFQCRYVDLPSSHRIWTLFAGLEGAGVTEPTGERAGETEPAGERAGVTELTGERAWETERAGVTEPTAERAGATEPARERETAGEPDWERTPTPLILIHGFAGGLGLWVQNLQPLSCRRPLLAFDLLGFGRSSRPPFPAEPGAAEEQFVESIEEWRERLALPSMILLGHSLGGYLAAGYCIKYPHR
ncbi:(Lyso)-N-acylphosphatidylethanolamine lipase-like [Rhinoraja longicauda]